MSIIHEALKKAGEPVVAGTPKAPEKGPGFRPEFLRKKQRSAWGPFAAVLVLLIVGTPVFAPLIGKGRSDREVSMGSSLSGSRMSQQFGVEEVRLTPAMPSPVKLAPGRMGTFSLKGLIYSAGGSYALINGKVVEVGDRIGDATLVQITPNEAVLERGGEQIVLTA